MDKLSFWKQKIVQAFHDPPAKPYAWYPGTGGHKKIAEKLFRLFSGEHFKYYARYPDWAASGADRPVIDPTKGKGVSPLQVRWPDEPCLTHPLSPGPVLDVRAAGEDTPAARAEIRERVLGQEEEIVDSLREPSFDWQDAEDLRVSFFRLWRRFREELAASRKSAEEGDLLWEAMPADSRTPDVSVWDHLRVAAALAFISPAKLPEHHEPWFFKFSIGPVQSFIQEARTGRDLWIGSFILSDLAWHAMEPFVRHYGPDAVVYPDLRGNPLADNRLTDSFSEFLPGDYRNPRTFAAMLPDSFTALVPRGKSGGGHLIPIEELADRARKGVEKRWKNLADIVRDWLAENVEEKTAWLDIWNRQHEKAVHTCWTALAWKRAEPLIDPRHFRARALPFQKAGFRLPASEEEKPTFEKDRKAVSDRKTRLAPFMPRETWARYELCREVYGMTNLKFLQNERGFEYAATHHQLNARHRLRQSVSPAYLDAFEEYGEICTVCGKRQALTGSDPKSEKRIDGARKSAREFWKDPRLDPEKKGRDRLCGVCAMKRYLIVAGFDSEKNELTGLNPIWAGAEATYRETADSDGKIRVPFPSTSTIAAQRYLVALARDPSLEEAMQAVNSAFDKTKLPRTTFPRVLPRLAQAARNASPVVGRFLEIEAQESVFPDALEGKRKGLGDDREADGEALEGLIEATKNLRRAAQKKHGAPGAHIAVILMDGDRMGRLLLGDEEMIGARMKDIFHPKAVEKILEHEQLKAAGWPDLLEAKRLAGPSFHAFVSRALANFSHRMVPWVVEREFGGRLIYTGGDDVLCIAPASDAFLLTARLQQLFSAPWVIDTGYRHDPWSWRSKDWKGESRPYLDRRRFAVIDSGKIPYRENRRAPLRLPVDPEYLEPHPCDGDWAPEDQKPAAGRVFPMLGRRSSMSAGIAFAHFKTPMSILLEQSHRLLDRVAKEINGRGSIAASHFSRNGMKTEFVMRWGAKGERPTAHAVLASVREGFTAKKGEERGGALPSRLPYKLREISRSAAVALEQIRSDKNGDVEEREQKLLEGLFASRLRGSFESRAAGNAFELWRVGMGLRKRLYDDIPERSVEGLLLVRALAGFGGGEPCAE